MELKTFTSVICLFVILFHTRVWHFGFKTSRFWNFSTFFMVSVSVLENFGIKKVSVSVSLRFGIKKNISISCDKFWYRKKYRYWFRKDLVLKSIWIGVKTKLVLESIGIGFKKYQSKKVLDFSGYKLVLLTILFQVLSNPLRPLHTDSFPRTSLSGV